MSGSLEDLKKGQVRKPKKRNPLIWVWLWVAGLSVVTVFQSVVIGRMETTRSPTTTTSVPANITKRIEELERVAKPLNYNLLLQQLKVDLNRNAAPKTVEPKRTEPKRVPLDTRVVEFVETPRYTKKNFRRDLSIPLVDQANNPGALNVGKFTLRYGCIEAYSYQGNGTAICDTIEDGIAALVDLILSHEGLTVKEYVLGGPNLPRNKSFSGGGDYNDYLLAMAQRGIDINQKVVPNVKLLEDLVRAHHFSEGGKRKFSKADFDEAFNLVRRHRPAK